MPQEISLQPPYIGSVHIHPSELIYTSHMLYDNRELPNASDREENAGAAMLRARYRGPFESYKLNKNKADTDRDLKLIAKQLNKERKRLIDSMSLMMDSISYPSVIKYIDVAHDDRDQNEIRYYSIIELKTSAADLQRQIDLVSDRMKYWTVGLS